MLLINFAFCGNWCSEWHALLSGVNEFPSVRYAYCRSWMKFDIRDVPTVWLRICKLREDLLGGVRNFCIGEITFTCTLWNLLSF